MLYFRNLPHGKCSHATSKVDIDDISFTLNLSFNSFLRDDLLINFLVSLFTPCKNFTSVPFNLGKICLKQISSLFTITSHKKESLRPIFLFLPLVVTIVDSFPSRECIYIYLCAYIYRALHGIKLKKSRATNCFAFFLTFLETWFSKTHKNQPQFERERSIHDINPEISSVRIARCAFRFFVFTFIYIQSASKMVNSRMHALTCALFFTQNLHSFRHISRR